jgi:hypothetical protein
VCFDVGSDAGTACQVGLANVLMSDNCKSNPSQGKALISELQAKQGSDASKWLQLDYVKLQFDSKCDHQAYVQFGRSSYGPIQGRRVALQFKE